MTEDAIAKLRERAKAGESDSQAAQRLLNDLLGTTKEIELTEVDNRIQEAIAPIKQELEELRTELKNLGKSVA
jgi:phosphoserine phosphatase